MSLISRIHGGFVYGRRVRVLSEILSRLIPRSAEILDVGCGDGVIDSLIMAGHADPRAGQVGISLQMRSPILRAVQHLPLRRPERNIRA
jgi:hypothetical protein